MKKSLSTLKIEILVKILLFLSGIFVDSSGLKTSINHSTLNSSGLSNA